MSLCDLTLADIARQSVSLMQSEQSREKIYCNAKIEKSYILWSVIKIKHEIV